MIINANYNGDNYEIGDSIETSISDLEGVAEEWIDIGGFTKSTYSTFVRYEGDGVSGNTDYIFSIVLKRTSGGSIQNYYSWAGERNTNLANSTRIIFDSVNGSNVFGYISGGSTSVRLDIYDYDGSGYSTDEVELVSMRVKMPV
jgi:hypothetical protein